MSVEPKGVREISIGLSEISETAPNGHLVLKESVAWVKLNQDLRNLLNDVACGVQIGGLAIIKLYRHRIILVCWLLVSEKCMEVEAIEWVKLHIRSPSDSLDAVVQRCRLGNVGARLGDVLLVGVVGLLNLCAVVVGK